MTRSTPDPAARVTLHVCLTCRTDADAGEVIRPGRRLHNALVAALPAASPIAIAGVECLSNCSRACTVALTGPGRWAYVYGDLDPDTAIDGILDGAARYAATEDGLVPWRERPKIFRKGVIARIPAIS